MERQPNDFFKNCATNNNACKDKCIPPIVVNHYLGQEIQLVEPATGRVKNCPIFNREK